MKEFILWNVARGGDEILSVRVKLFMAKSIGIFVNNEMTSSEMRENSSFISVFFSFSLIQNYFLYGFEIKEYYWILFIVRRWQVHIVGCPQRKR